MSKPRTDIATVIDHELTGDTVSIDQATWSRVAVVLADAESLLHGGVDLENQQATEAVMSMATAARELSDTAMRLLNSIDELHNFAEIVATMAVATRHDPVWTSWMDLAAAAGQDLQLTRTCLTELACRRIAVPTGYHGGPAIDPMHLQPDDEFCLTVDTRRLDAFIKATAG